jgi:hypothetical protein
VVGSDRLRRNGVTILAAALIAKLAEHPKRNVEIWKRGDIRSILRID